MDFLTPRPKIPNHHVMLLILMLAILLLVVFSAMILLAYSILSPPRMTDGKALYILNRVSPADLNLQFEAVIFSMRDHNKKFLNIAAWWIPHPARSEKTVVFIHGYADAKIGAIAWAPTWQKLGYHILAIDLRAHGESAGKFTTAGVLEKNDLNQILDQLHAQRAEQTREVVLFGISMGAAVALATAAGRDDLAALVLECPFANFRSALKQHLKFVEAPLSSTLPIVWRMMKWISRADLDEVQPLELIAKVPASLMIIQSGRDSLITSDDANAIQSALAQRSRSTLWHLPTADHLAALSNDPEEYLKRIEKFLSDR